MLKLEFMNSLIQYAMAPQILFLKLQFTKAVALPAKYNFQRKAFLFLWYALVCFQNGVSIAWLHYQIRLRDLVSFGVIKWWWRRIICIHYGHEHAGRLMQGFTVKISYRTRLTFHRLSILRRNVTVQVSSVKNSCHLPFVMLTRVFLDEGITKRHMCNPLTGNFLNCLPDCLMDTREWEWWESGKCCPGVPRREDQWTLEEAQLVGTGVL